MPDINGLQIANLLNGKPVIFATAYKEYAADAFDLNAIDYIVKPIKIDRLKQAVDKVSKQISPSSSLNNKKFINLTSNNKSFWLYKLNE